MVPAAAAVVLQTQQHTDRAAKMPPRDPARAEKATGPAPSQQRQQFFLTRFY